MIFYQVIATSIKYKCLEFSWIKMQMQGNVALWMCASANDITMGAQQ